MDIFSLHKKFIECNQEISTDTRTLVVGSMFFAWKGETIDGNTFVVQALEKGARYVVIDNPEYLIDERCILVKNSITTLQELAHYHRKKFDIPVIAVGGSNGKTTTKELITSVLASQKDIIASLGSLNNHVGVPKTLLRITSKTDIAVIEMGANHIGEITKLCEIAHPTHGIITNIGRDHIGLFGGVGAVIESNLELYRYIHNHSGHVFVNKDDTQLVKYASGIPQTYYGKQGSGDYFVHSNQTTPYVSLKWKQHTISTQLTGEYNIDNIATAIAVGVYFNVIDTNIKKEIESYVPTNNRSQIITTNNDNIVIKDFYNANRTSMELALDNLHQVASSNTTQQSIAIVGDMLELGQFSLSEHQAVVDYIMTKNFNRVLLIGPDFKQTHHVGCESYDNVDQAISTLQKIPLKKSIILLKASNGTNFTKLFNEVDW